MNPLIILEMANNHSGSLSHGKEIIEAYSKICARYANSYDFVFKFQYRELNTFIRKDMAGDFNIPLIKRFSETRLTADEFQDLIKCCRENSFETMVTPFDESSIKTLVAHGVDYIKIASCSFGDWPLMEAIAKTGKPVVASCAGASQDTVDNVVAFFENRNIFLILQHCVGEYPTAAKDINVGQVGFLRNRYPKLKIGFSSHEEPSTIDIAPLALAQGAHSFEKHVALETETIKKNKYSTDPGEFSLWIESLHRARIMQGTTLTRYEPSEKESKSLRNLQRGVFLGKDIKAGQIINLDDVYFAFPPSDGQLTANDLSKYIRVVARETLSLDSPIMRKSVEISNYRDTIQDIANSVSILLKESSITFPQFADLEISHHYGVDRFKEYGLTMITVVNREYCKKLLILLPGQSHPEQYHKRKEETFHVLWGSGTIKLDGESTSMRRGDVFVISPGTRHFFSSDTGIVLEEISSTHYADDSFYTDTSIHDNKNRKTYVSHWSMS
ncbi:MAG: cupin domain-containing protein [Synechococcus sp. YX04-3]|nr:MAG: cupin domain-containing protein [Synechococcus sp. YX04-3]